MEFGVIRGVIEPCRVEFRIEIVPDLQAANLRAYAEQDRRAHGGRHIGNMFGQFDIFRTSIQKIVRQYAPHGAPAESANLFGIDAFEKRGLIEFRRSLKIPEQFFF